MVSAQAQKASCILACVNALLQPEYMGVLMENG